LQAVPVVSCTSVAFFALPTAWAELRRFVIAYVKTPFAFIRSANFSEQHVRL